MIVYTCENCITAEIVARMVLELICGKVKG